jgi:hypothetical protein
MSPIGGAKVVLRTMGDLDSDSDKINKDFKKLKTDGEKTKGSLKGRNFGPEKVEEEDDDDGKRPGRGDIAVSA